MKEEVLSPAGSNRQYVRVTDEQGRRYIRVRGTSRDENHAFIGMARHFKSRGLNVPAILSVSDDEMEYTQEDLGDTLLFDAIRAGRESGVFSEEEKTLLRRTIRLLAHFQVEGAKGMDWSLCYPVPAFDRQSVLWDLNYFKYCFLKPTGLEFREDKLESDFQKMADNLTREGGDSFLYRDFQSRNIMISDEGNIYFIDFQGGRKGPKQYDVASFLWQAKANLPQSLREELVDDYLDELSTIEPVDRKAFKELLQLFVLFRTLQVLGAYGFRGYFERKPHFIESIPYAIANLRQWLNENVQIADTYPYLSEMLRELVSKWETGKGEKKNNEKQEAHSQDRLVVRVNSFSYKKGIPTDESGNGGGFVFDCRAVHNPGRYEQYKGLTGMDQAVIDFLEKDGEIFPFLHAAEALVDQSVERYLERGFKDLMVSFGCTGGQHRSVYSAEKMAKHLNEKYGVEVRISHLAQDLVRTLPPR
ncbi:MAG: phosphotransferase [Paludibacteraceae bacterium]|nr:phosphotransferase [Paludibacteraceae bacterium]